MEWNIILLSILIALSGLQLIICFLKVAAELKRTLCGTYSVFVQVTKYQRWFLQPSSSQFSFSNFSQLGTYPFGISVLYAATIFYQRICTDNKSNVFNLSTKSLCYTGIGGCSLWHLRLGLRRKNVAGNWVLMPSPLLLYQQRLLSTFLLAFNEFNVLINVWVSQQTEERCKRQYVAVVIWASIFTMFSVGYWNNNWEGSALGKRISWTAELKWLILLTCTLVWSSVV